MSSERALLLGRFATRHALLIVFLTLALCLAGGYAAFHSPSSVFPATDFPRVVILANNGITPTDEMMATITRPIEEAMKEVPGAVSVRSATRRGSAQVNVFFDWKTAMPQAELFVLGRLAEIRASLPAATETEVERVTFSAFPVIGLSLTSSNRDLMNLWETATYSLKPRFLAIPGVAKIEILGGHIPEFHVLADPLKLTAAHLTLSDLSQALTKNNLVAPAGMMEKDYHLFLASVDGRLGTVEDLKGLLIPGVDGRAFRLETLARIERAPAPAYTAVTAQGQNAVLLNIQSQPNGSTLDIARAVKIQIGRLKSELPPDIHLDYFYDQSRFLRDSLRSVFDAMGFGLVLSVIILFAFLRNWGGVLTAIVAIPISILITFLVIKIAGLSINMMTLGGIAAAIGLVIDDAIVVVEAMCVKMVAGQRAIQSIQDAVAEILHPLIGSTLTPVVVFFPLAYLTGVAGIFFRALALTMVASLVTSLLLSLTLTPSLASWLLGARKGSTSAPAQGEPGKGFLMPRVMRLYAATLRVALGHRFLALLSCALFLVVASLLYQRLDSDFLPSFDEGGFVIDFWAPPGTSLTESSRILNEAENLIRENPDVEGYSRRLGAEMGLFITEPYRGDFAVQLEDHRSKTTEEIIAGFRHAFAEKFPMIRWEFPGILTDVIGDLQLTPNPIEIKLFSPDLHWLKESAPRVREIIKKIPGVVDEFDGLTLTGPSINFRPRFPEAAHYGLTTQDIADNVNTALMGRLASSLFEGDHFIAIRVLSEPKSVNQPETLSDLSLRIPGGQTVRLSQVASLVIEPSEVELNRENSRQDVVVTARLEGRDLGSAMREIQTALKNTPWLPPGQVEYGGLFEQQLESFHNLLLVLGAAIGLVFTVLLLEFRTLAAPLAIVFGSILALSGTVAALQIAGITLNIVSFLGAIIGIGIVAKNGILMLDSAQQFEASGLSTAEALQQSGQRRLRPVLMTSLAAGLGMLPLALGVGAGADMLRPLAVSVIGALCISVALSLIATPVLYSLIRRTKPATSAALE